MGAVVMCSHGGQAQPSAPFPRVMLSGQPAVTVPAPMIIAGCGFVPPAGNGPCVTGQWLIGSVRVLGGGQPLVLMTSASICAPTGTPMMIVSAQPRVMAT